MGGGGGGGASHVLHMRDIRYDPEECIKITSLFDCIAMSWPSCRFALYLMYSENCQSSWSMGMACLCRVSTCRFALYLMYSENCQSSGSMGMACLCRVRWSENNTDTFYELYMEL